MPITSINGEPIGVGTSSIPDLYKLLHSLGNVNSSTVSDADAVYRNTVYYITNTANISNLPTNHAGMLITFGSGAADTTTTPAAQLYVEIVNTTSDTWQSLIWFRSRHGATNSKWSDWISVGDIADASIGYEKLDDSVNNRFVHNIESSVTNDNYATYFGSPADFNNAPRNSILTLSGTWTSTANNNPSIGAGTLATLSGRDGTGSIQLYSYWVLGSNYLYYRMSWGSASSPQWSDWTLLNKDRPHVTMSMFRNVGVIGDSYSNGATQRANGSYIFGDSVERYISWLQILARKNGFTGTNFTKGGLTTRTWLTDSEGLTAMQAADPQDAYFIMLGINDSKDDDRYVAVGNSSDFTTTSNPPDTFYGNMGVIYRAVKAKNSKAVIVFCTCCRFGDRYEPYSEAIRTMASTSGSLLIDFENISLVKGAWWSQQMVATHPTAKMYVALANAMEEEFSNVAYEGNDLLNVYYG